MANDVKIHIKNEQIIYDAENGLDAKQSQKDQIVLDVVGQYSEKNENKYILYEEKIEETGMIVKNTIKLMPGKMQLSKKGAFSVTMLFEPECEHKTGYITPYGTLQMLVRTKQIQIEENEKNLSVHVVYELDLNDAPLSYSDMHITVDKGI